MSVTSFTTAKERVLELERILQEHGMQLGAGSALGELCNLAVYLEQIPTGQESINEMRDIRTELSACAGLAEFIKLIILANEKGRLTPLLGHLELLNRGNPSMTVSAPGRSLFRDASNKLFEFYIAPICVQFAEHVELAPVNDNTGENPDILLTLASTQYALACKVPNGTSPLTLFDRIKEGVDQIGNSPASTGFVVISFRNLLDLAQFWVMKNQAAWAEGREVPKFVVYSDPAPIQDALRNRVDEVNAAFVEYNEPAPIRGVFAGKTAQPAVICFVQSVVPLIKDGLLKPTTVGLIGLMDFGTVSPQALQLVQALNAVMRQLNEP